MSWCGRGEAWGEAKEKHVSRAALTDIVYRSSGHSLVPRFGSEHRTALRRSARNRQADVSDLRPKA